MTGARPTPVARFARLATLAAVVFVGAALPASAQELLTNGNFETGTLAGWTVTSAQDPNVGGTGAFVLSAPAAATPISTHPTLGNGTGGSFYAVSDQSNPTVAALSQTFTVPPGGGTVTLHFQMFVNDWNGLAAIIDPSGLNVGAFGVPANQHARVDLLTSGASAFDTGAGVIRNFYLGTDPNNPSTTLNPYQDYTFDITANAGGGGGGTFQIRFAEVDNQFYLNQGVDNVSIVFAPAVPVMNPWVLASVGCLLVIGLVMTLSKRGRLTMA